MNKIKYLVLLLPLLLNGCYNYQEINDIGIITSIYIDYNKEYQVNVEMIDPAKENNSSYIYYSASASSIEESLKEILLKCSKKLYGSHLQILILSKDAIEYHFDEILDFFMRDPEFRSEFKVVMMENSTNDNILSSDIIDSLKMEEDEIGIIKSYTLNDIASMYLNPNIEIALPSIIISNDKPIIDKVSIFKDKKYLGSLNTEEAITLNIIKGDIKNTILNIPINDSYIIFEPNKLHTKTNIDINNNTINVQINGYARISEVSSNINIEDKKEIEILNKDLNNYIEKMVSNNFISIRDKYNSDIFGIKDLYYKHSPSSIKNISWYNDIFPNINIKVKSKIKLYEKGNTKGGITYERKNR